MTAFAASPAEAQGDLTQFAATPLWLTLIKILVVFVVLILLTLFTTYFERRVIARLQQRIGPNRVGPAGLLQPLADGLKLAFKQGIIPRDAHVLVYLLAPMIAATCAFLTFAVIPVGPEVSIFGVVTPLQITDFPESVLYVFAVVSIGVYGVVLAGWASGSTYSLLGALRSTAQLISYEIAMGLSFVAVFLYAGSMSTSQIVEGQVDTWYIVLLLPSFVIYAVSMVGETNRAPFDLPEAEGELVAGFMTEYSGLRLGDVLPRRVHRDDQRGRRRDDAVPRRLARAGTHLHGVGRKRTRAGGRSSGSSPRCSCSCSCSCGCAARCRGCATTSSCGSAGGCSSRWAIGWVVLVATLRAVRNEYTVDTRTIFITLGAILVVLALGLIGMDYLRGEQSAEPEAEPAFDPYAGGFPVPPLPGQHLDVTPRAGRTIASTVTASALSGHDTDAPETAAAVPGAVDVKEDPRG